MNECHAKHDLRISVVNTQRYFHYIYVCEWRDECGAFEIYLRFQTALQQGVSRSFHCNIPISTTLFPAVCRLCEIQRRTANSAEIESTFNTLHTSTSPHAASIHRRPVDSHSRAFTVRSFLHLHLRFSSLSSHTRWVLFLSRRLFHPVHFALALVSSCCVYIFLWLLLTLARRWA